MDVIDVFTITMIITVVVMVIGITHVLFDLIKEHKKMQRNKKNK